VAPSQRKYTGVFLLVSGIIFPGTADFAAPTESKLRVSNPFYLPYGKEVLLGVGVSHAQQKSGFDVPAQSITVGSVTVPFSAGSSESKASSVVATAGAAVGVVDRFILGVTGRFLVDETTRTASTGSLSSLTGSSNRSGAYAPEFAAIVRLAGMKKNSWYLDFRGNFTPGIKSSDPYRVVSSQHAVHTNMSFGRNHGAWTAGIGVSATYLFEADNNGTRIRPYTILWANAVLQYDFGDVFTRLRGEWFTLADAESRNDALSRQIKTSIYLENGFHLAENFITSVSFFYQPQVSADYNTSGIRYTQKSGSAIGVVLSFLMRF
jgi:hypothetical protein